MRSFTASFLNVILTVYFFIKTDSNFHYNNLIIQFIVKVYCKKRKYDIANGFLTYNVNVLSRIMSCTYI